jgi:hypothetical protein
MSTYTFRNTETDEIVEHKMSYKELDQFQIDNPILERYHSAETLPSFGDAIRMSVPGTKKADSTFEKYVIDRIKTSVPGNTLKDNHKTSSGNKEW